MARSNYPLATTGSLAVAGDLVAMMADADATAGDDDFHRLADQPPGNAVGVGVALDRCFTSGAMDAGVGDLAHPPGKMRLQFRPAGELMAGNRIVLDVADAALVLALGACPVRCASPRREAPITGKGAEPWVEGDLAGNRVVAVDQGPGIVEEHFLRHAAEVAKRRLDAVKPNRLPLMPEGAHEEASRIAKRGDEQVEPQPLAADRRPCLTKVDLQLMPRRRLETQRRPRFRHQC